MNTPFFTVIIASFNAGEKLRETIDSVLAQTEDDYEIIVKDAGSKDGSLERIPEDPRIRLICRKDRGIYDGMNEALSSAQGEMVYFLNCGDMLCDASVLKTVREAAEQHETRKAIFYGDVLEMKTGQRVAANPQMSHFAMYRYLPCHQACFYTRSLFAARRFDTQYRVRADYEHFLYCVMKEHAETICLPIVVARYEGNGFSETRQGRAWSKEEHKKITAEYFTPRERFLFHAYLVLTLQPVREKIATGKHTAALYDAVKNAVYRRKGRGTR